MVSQYEYPVKMSHSYTVHIDYTQFREYLVENDDAGPWGDTYFHEVFDEYVEDNSIEIEYKYGDYKDGKTTILWRLAAEEGKGKVYKVRYGGSSQTFSYLINNKSVDKASEAIGKTLFRPSGILAGAIVTLLGSIYYLVITHSTGFKYNFYVATLMFVGGFVTGLILEAIYRLFAGKKD